MLSHLLETIENVRFATVEYLVIHKLVAGRPRDIEDARLVLAKNPGIDDSYVRSWLEQFGTALKTDFVQQFEDDPAKSPMFL